MERPEVEMLLRLPPGLHPVRARLGDRFTLSKLEIPDHLTIE